MIRFTITHSSVNPPGNLYALKNRVPENDTATTVGVSNSFMMGFRTLAPTLAGYMFESLSTILPFISGTILVFLNAGFYLSFYGEDEDF